MIVDTNALLLPGEFGVDIFAELERLGYVHALIPRAVVRELERLSVSPGATGRDRRAAVLGRSLLEQMIHSSDQTRSSFGLQVSIAAADEGGGAGEAGGDTDALIVALAVEQKAAVLTSDEELRKTLARAGIVTVYLRGGTRLEERE